jgi:hypothetical protein
MGTGMSSVARVRSLHNDKCETHLILHGLVEVVIVVVEEGVADCVGLAKVVDAHLVHERVLHGNLVHLVSQLKHKSNWFNSHVAQDKSQLENLNILLFCLSKYTDRLQNCIVCR